MSKLKNKTDSGIIQLKLNNQKAQNFIELRISIKYINKRRYNPLIQIEVLTMSVNNVCVSA